MFAYRAPLVTVIVMVISVLVLHNVMLNAIQMKVAADKLSDTVTSRIVDEELNVRNNQQNKIDQQCLRDSLEAYNTTSGVPASCDSTIERLK